MSDLNLKEYNPLYPMRVHPYEELLKDQNASVIDKINSIIVYLNSVGKLTSDVVKNWNTVYNWVMNDGLTTGINNKLESMLAKGEFNPIFNDILTKIGDIATLTTTDKSNLTKAINEIVLKIGNLSNLTTTDKTSLVNSINENTSKLIENTSHINDISIDIEKYGFKGDGVNDDAVSIQNAVNYATSLIQSKSSSTDMFAGQVTIQLPPRKIYIKSKINVPNAVTIQGHGTATTLMLSANLDYIFDFNRYLTGFVTSNEESQMEGGSLKNLRISGNKRQYTLTSAVRLYGVDHFLMDTVFFYAIKGKCIELKTARECNFNNIFTRFCGSTTQGNIEIVEHDAGSDTSNLNFGSNWNIVFPYGSALKIVDGEFIKVDGLLVHGIFSTIKSNLSSYFGVDEYNTLGNHQIDLQSGSILKVTNCNFVYVPNTKSAISANNSTCYVSNFSGGQHYNPTETHGSGDSAFNISNNGIVYLNTGINVSTGSTDGDIITNDGTGKVYGTIINRPLSTNINSTMTNVISSQELIFDSDKSKPAVFRPWSDETNTAIGGEGYINYDFRTTKTKGDKSILHVGIASDGITPITAIPNEATFRLPISTTANMPLLHGTMWIDAGDGSVKICLYGTVKTVTLT